MHNLLDLKEKIHFMTLEVIRQLESVKRIIRNPDPQVADRVKNRDDLIDNYKAVIENICFSRIHGHHYLTREEADFVRAVNIISNNLERISDFAVNILGQLNHLHDMKTMQSYRYRHYFQQITISLELVVQGLFNRDHELALRICKSEFIVDKLFKKSFRQILEDLHSADNKSDLITCLFIFRYLERMGDSMLNIGEAIIFSVFGEKLKIHQYHALMENLGSMDNELSFEEIGFESIWESRSGCRIGKIMDSGQRNGQAVLFKEGRIEKIAREKANIEKWKSIFPSLVPRIISYSQNSKNASMLMDFLQGCSVQDTVLSRDRESMDNAAFILKETLSIIWHDTLENTAVKPDFISQMIQRLDDVIMIHPEFNFSDFDNSLSRPLPEKLLQILSKIETELSSPFSVFIHGDFNTNNILYNQKNQQIYFIDLHRSRYGDYVQDISVFLVSNYRMPVFYPDVRRAINKINKTIFCFANQFAAENSDNTFHARLALGLIRSFYTSTRFELNRELSRSMYNRSLQLAQLLLAHQGKPWRDFSVPRNIFDYP